MENKEPDDDLFDRLNVSKIYPVKENKSPLIYDLRIHNINPYLK